MLQRYVALTTVCFWKFC